MFVSAFVDFAASQTAHIRLDTVSFDNSFQSFLDMKFSINGVMISANDTAFFDIQLDQKMDKFIAFLGEDSLQVYTKFKPNSEYIIKPGCCCAAFIIEPAREPNKGTVSLTNSSNRDLGVIICDHNIDTIRIGSTYTSFAHESAMCFMKPCRIRVVEMSYFEQVISTDSDFETIDYANELDEYVLFDTWFNFLHGEKLELVYNKHTDNFKLKIKGYLTDKEIDQILISPIE